jgi:hypothetical protein
MPLLIIKISNGYWGIFVRDKWREVNHSPVLPEQIINTHTLSSLTSGNVTASVVQLSAFLATDPEVRIRFPAPPDFLRSSGSGMGSTQSRE